MNGDVKAPKPWEKKPPKPAIKPGESGIKVTPVSPPPSKKPTTPLPKASLKSIPLSPTPLGPEAPPKKKDVITPILLFLAIILNSFTLWVLISIVQDKIPDFLANL